MWVNIILMLFIKTLCITYVLNFLISKWLSLITKLLSAPLSRYMMCLPLRSRDGLLHTSAVYTVEPLLSPVTAPLTLTAPPHSLSLVALSTFLLSDIFTGEYFLLIFSFLHLYLFSTSSFDLRSAWILFFLWIQLRRFLMFCLLGEGERQVLVNFGS